MVAQRKTAEPAVVNGINVDDLFPPSSTASGGMPQKARQTGASSRPGRARRGAAHKSRASELAVERVPRQFSIDIDEPCELGGSNRFANPQEHLLAALNGCMMVG